MEREKDSICVCDCVCELYSSCKIGNLFVFDELKPQTCKFYYILIQNINVFKKLNFNLS